MKHPDLLDGASPVAFVRVWGEGIIVDNFAGGGGASTGIEAAIERPVDLAINHDAEAVAMHLANHPATHHLCQSIYAVDPLEAVSGRPVLGAWFSPDCKHFSKAKGGKPVEKNIRDLAWTVVHWAERLGPQLRPQIIWLENVEEFRTWGPLGADDKPDPARKGETFDEWVGRLRRAGYKVQWRELRACDYGAPTSRKRLFIVARCDGEPIVWPEPTHGKPGSPEVLSGKRLPWRTAAEIIDWSIPCPSIFTRKKELKDATKRRIAHGIMRFVVNSPKPFIVPITHSGGDSRVHSADDPLRTVTTAARGEFAMVAPVFARTAHGERDSKGKKRGKGDHGPAEPFPTVLSSQDSALISATIVGCGGRRGQSGPVDVLGPYPTTTAKGDACLVTAALISNQYTSNTNGGRGDPDRPFKTVTAGGGHHALVAVSLVSVDNTSTRAIRAFEANDPLRTVTSSGGGFAAVSATLIQMGYGEREGQAPRVLDLHMPLGTIVAGGIKHSVATALLVPHVMTMRNAQKPYTAGDEPTHTITAGGAHQNLVSAFLHKYRPDHPGQSLDDPAPTVTANSYIKRPGGAPPLAVVTAHIAQHNSGKTPNAGRTAEAPLSTITSSGSHQQLVATTVMKLRGTSKDGQPIDVPLHTLSAGGTHFAEVAAFLIKYYGNENGGYGFDQPIGTATTKERFGLVTVTIDGEEYVIADIGMRMLTPRELARAQGFPDDYILDPIVNGKPLTKTAQIRMIGNSVCPPLSEALVRANLADAIVGVAAVAA
ncbi:MAG TPA: DNA cytosine methyltransferase [Allosphingosinicella sp.]|jgi:DNA (cytosine-5)-methyltransferase 1|nr:DNA cytosine methyltransferase [Allosphingosinicella sp.]